MTDPLRLAALLTRCVRGPRVRPIRAAGDRLLRAPATAHELAAALTVQTLCAETRDPVGVLLGALRVLCEEQPRGIGLDRAVTRCAALDGHDVRETEARRVLAAMVAATGAALHGEAVSTWPRPNLDIGNLLPRPKDTSR